MDWRTANQEAQPEVLGMPCRLERIASSNELYFDHKQVQLTIAEKEVVIQIKEQRQQLTGCTLHDVQSFINLGKNREILVVFQKINLRISRIKILRVENRVDHVDNTVTCWQSVYH